MLRCSMLVSMPSRLGRRIAESRLERVFLNSAVAVFVNAPWKQLARSPVTTICLWSIGCTRVLEWPSHRAGCQRSVSHARLPNPANVQ